MRQQYIEHSQAIEILLVNNLLKQSDISFAKSLFNQKDMGWTEPQARAIHKLLSNYKNELSTHKIELAEPKSSPVTEQKWTAKTNEEGDINLHFTSPDRNIFFKTVGDIKDIPGRKYTSKTKIWSIPFSVKNIKRIKEIGFKVDQDIQEWYNKHTDDKFIKSQNAKYDPKKLQKIVNIPEMFPYQIEGLAFIEKMNGRALIGDQMGLGKSLQALSFLKLHSELRPAIIIVPATLKINWQRETKKWINEDSFIINGKNNVEAYAKEKIVIINYDIVKDHADSLKKLNPSCIILDEVHRTKNSKAQRTKAVKKLCKGVDNIIALSGTPILNRPMEIFNICNILQPEVFPSWYRFGQKYCDPKHNGFGTTYNGVSNYQELHELLTEHVMIRRKKTDVLKDLPEKRKSLIPFEIDRESRIKYQKAERDVVNFIYEQKGKDAAERASRAEVLAKFNALKQITAQGKMDGVIDWIENFLESEEKLVLFAVHKKVIDAIMEKFPDISVKIDGSCSQKQRQEAVDSFQNNDKICLFIGNLVAASEGITLTASSNVAFIELGWTPGLHEQASDRIHRIGQKNACMVYYLLAQDTLEEDIAEMLDGKQKTCTAILDGEEVPDENLLSELMKKFENKKGE